MAGCLRPAQADGYRVSVVQNPTLSLEGDAAATRMSSTSRTGRRSSSATPTAARSSPRRARRERRRRSSTSAPSRRQGRVGEHADRRLPDRRAAAADPAARRRVPVPRPGQVPRSRSPATSRRDRRCSWPTRRCRGASRRSAARHRARVADKPSWYLVTTEDRMIPPAAQRTMSERIGATVVEVDAQPLRLRLSTRRRRGPDQASGGRRDEGSRHRRVIAPSPCAVRSPDGARVWRPDSSCFHTARDFASTRVQSACIRCTWCDGYPCLVHAKSDAETIAVRPVLDLPNITLLVDAEVTKSRNRRFRTNGDERGRRAWRCMLHHSGRRL